MKFLKISSLNILQTLEGIVGKDKLVASTSTPLLHTVVDIINETKLDIEIKSSLVVHKDEAFFSSNAEVQASRKSAKLSRSSKSLILMFWFMENPRRTIWLSISKSNCLQNLPVYAAVDKRLLQIILTIVGNAVKFTKVGYVSIDVSVSTSSYLKYVLERLATITIKSVEVRQ
ncbi:5-methyltetrahydropteroyltriglutamate--homocysteine methyltransferase [Olea europaea subsp. europaea]|uniref:5-methyltetrahydropteroyltriglutamate--homocysteine methyltransferase n=1 Tax=Olea europaea subsp. europaea TaxID=158383 RepID=A0A8S0RUF9_OLEEU|nr:5-methyltetrahydropteroyltriglutamate--homocysteine methyltransferase [Olea europaea subsp. europaea]